MSHIVNECQLTMLAGGGLQGLDLVVNDVINWLDQMTMKSVMQ